MDLMYMQNSINKRSVLRTVSVYLTLYMFTILFKGIIQKNNVVGYYVAAIFIVTMCHLIISYKKK